MTGLTGAVRGGGGPMMVAIKPVDFRKGAAGLAVLVRAKMAADPFYGTLYVFRGKQAHRENRSGAGARLQICRSPTDVPVAQFCALEGIDLVQSTRRMERLLGR